MNNNSDEYVEKLDMKKSGDFVINIGIQYNSINDTKNPILSIYEGRENPAIILYQNGVTFQNIISEDTREIFIRKSQDYDPGTNYDEDNNLLKSHLITISWVKVNVDLENRKNTYQGYVYVDGILAGATTTFSSATATFNKVIFHPGNYNVNLFEITYFESNNLYSFNDIDAVYYYNTF
jgi:hypothetical protein